MIRLYLDWNVFTDLKTDGYADLRQFLLEGKDRFIMPFTATHFRDSESSHHLPVFFADLEMMQSMCEDHFMKWGDGSMVGESLTPKEAFGRYTPVVPDNFILDIEEVFEDLDRLCLEHRQPLLGTLFKQTMQQPVRALGASESAVISAFFPTLNSRSTVWDVIKDMGSLLNDLQVDKGRHIKIRESFRQDGISLPDRSHNLKVADAIGRLEDLVKFYGLGTSFREFLDRSFKDQKDPPDDKVRFAWAYLLVDWLGFEPDRLGGNGLSNFRYDGQHAFNAAHCDYLVTEDKILRAKAEGMYRLLDISTKVVSPKELIATLQEDTYPRPANIFSFADQIREAASNGTIVERYPFDQDPTKGTIALKADRWILDNFTHVATHTHSGIAGFYLLRKVVKNKSRFFFEKEMRTVLRDLIHVCGPGEDEDVEATITAMIEGEGEPEILWTNREDFGIRVEMEEGLFRPCVWVFEIRQGADTTESLVL